MGPSEEKEEEVEVSNAFKNQHIVYVPRKRLNFDVQTPDGKMALVYKTGDTGFDGRASRWYKVLGASLPTIVAADYLVPDP